MVDKKKMYVNTKIIIFRGRRRQGWSRTRLWNVINKDMDVFGGASNWKSEERNFKITAFHMISISPFEFQLNNTV